MPLTILELSDVHLNHKVTPTQSILNELDAVFTQSVLSQVDLIIIAGDLFDREVGLSDKELSPILLWVVRLLRACLRNDIVLRVLEGTPYHDRGQAAILETINTSYDIHSDVRHIDNLYIEHIDRFECDVLYIPDEYRTTCIETKQLVKKLLSNTGITQVDYTVMHGMVEHQLPKGIALDHHERDFYSGITRVLVFIGHVHTHSSYRNILAAGSFSRLQHGEEEPKGYWWVNVKKDQSWKATFIENTLATQFITFDLRETSIEEVKETFYTKVKTISEGSHIRVWYCDPAMENVIMAITIKQTLLHWKVIRKKPLTAELPVYNVIQSHLPPTLTDRSLKDITMSHITETHTTDPVLLKEIGVELDNLIEDHLKLSQ